MKLIKYSASLYLFFIIQSCGKDFLDVPDKRLFLREVYVKDLTSLNEHMNGTYAIVARDLYSFFNSIYAELAADNVKIGVGNSRNMRPHYQWQQVRNNETSNLNGNPKNLNFLWMQGYKVIHDCSFIVDNADKYRSEDLVKANNIKAQAYTLRALVHFMLVNHFSQQYSFSANGSHPGIPYITTPDWRGSYSRGTVTEVYNNLIKDLASAIELFPASNQIDRRVLNRNAAKALLARVYLFKEDYGNAIKYAREVTETVPLMAASVDGYPSKLFTDLETEALFQLTPADPNQHGFGSVFQGAYYTYNFFYCSGDLADKLTVNPNDVRSAWVQRTSSNDKITKFPSGVISGFSLPPASYYETLLRSSEMFLTCAEAYAKLGAAKEDSARYFLDAIRTRADATASSTTATGSALIESIYEERRKELAFEGLRLFDLMRWKKNIVRPGETDPVFQTLAYPSNKAVAPIPESDVRINKLSQNDSY